MLFFIFLELLYSMACELIVELEQIGYTLSLHINQRQKEKRQVFSRGTQFGISEDLLDGLQDGTLSKRHRHYLGKYALF